MLLHDFKNNFSAGELGTKFKGRVDLGLYTDGLSYLKSGNTTIEGSISNTAVVNESTPLFNINTPIGNVFQFSDSKHENGIVETSTTILYQELLSRRMVLKSFDKDWNELYNKHTIHIDTCDLLENVEAEYKEAIFIKRSKGSSHYDVVLQGHIVSEATKYTEVIPISLPSGVTITSVEPVTSTFEKAPLIEADKITIYNNVSENDYTQQVAIKKVSYNVETLYTGVSLPSTYFYDVDHFNGWLDEDLSKQSAVKGSLLDEGSNLPTKPTFTAQEYDLYIISVTESTSDGLDTDMNPIQRSVWDFTKYEKKIRQTFIGDVRSATYRNDYLIKVTNTHPTINADENIVIFHTQLVKEATDASSIGSYSFPKGDVSAFDNLNDYIEDHPSDQKFLLGQPLIDAIHTSSGKVPAELLWRHKSGTSEIEVKFYDKTHNPFDMFEFSTTRTITTGTSIDKKVLKTGNDIIWNQMATSHDLDPESVSVSDELPKTLAAVPKVNGVYPDTRAISAKPAMTAYLTNLQYAKEVQYLDLQINAAAAGPIKDSFNATKTAYTAVHTAHNDNTNADYTLNTYITYTYTKRPKESMPGEITISDDLKKGILNELYIAGGVARWKSGDIWTVSKVTTIDTTIPNETTGVVDLSWQIMDIGSVWFKSLSEPLYAKTVSVHGDRFIIANFGGDSSRVSMSQKNNFKSFKVQGYDSTDPIDTKIRTEKKLQIRRIAVFKSILFYTDLGIFSTSPSDDGSMSDISLVSKFIPSVDVPPSFLGEEIVMVDESKNKLFVLYLNEYGTVYQMKDLTQINDNMLGEIRYIVNVSSNKNRGYDSSVVYSNKGIFLVQYDKDNKTLSMSRLEFTSNGVVSKGFQKGLFIEGNSITVNTTTGECYKLTEATTKFFNMRLLQPKGANRKEIPSIMINNFQYKSIKIYCSGEYDLEVNGIRKVWTDNKYFSSNYSVVEFPELDIARNQELDIKILTDKPVTIFGILSDVEV